MARHYDAVTKQHKCTVSNRYPVHPKDNILLRRKSLHLSMIDEKLCWIPSL